MKALLLATAMIAAPLIAQSDTGTSITTKPATSSSADNALQDPSTPTEKDANQPNDTSITTRSATSPGPNMPDQAGQAPRASQGMAPAPADSSMNAPMGSSGGSQVVFQQPPTIAEAFPPPPPKESYPWCSRTVTDACKQRVDPK